MKLAIASIAAACASVSLSQVAFAAPYASGVSVTGTTGSFVLNQSADIVTVRYGNGTTQTIDGSTAGTKSFTLPTAASTYSITVARTSAPAGYTSGTTLQIGPDVGFNSPRGVAVNQNANNAAFGTVYVSNSAVGTGTIPKGDGLFVFNADLSDKFGQGNTARTGGLDFTTSTNSPYRVQVGQDSSVYISDIGTTAGLYRVDSTAQNGQLAVTRDTGLPFSSVIARGSLTTGNLTLYAINSTTTPNNNLLRYDVGSGPLPSSVTPVAVVTGGISSFPTTPGILTDLDISVSGKYFVTQNRAAGNEYGLRVYSADGSTVLFDSLAATKAAGLDGVPDNPAVGSEATIGQQDLLRNIYGITVTPDQKYAIAVDINNQLDVLQLDANGVPILASLKVIANAFPSATGNGRDISVDAAGNLYAVSSGTALLRAFDPGGATSYTTSFNGTAFTFGVTPAVVPEPTTLAALAGVGGLAFRRRRGR